MNFGSFFREKRLEGGLTLRAFCNRYGFDSAYISRLETNRLNPPNEEEKLSALAKALGLKQGGENWIKFFDLAYQAKLEFPPDVKKEASEILSLVPAFLRTRDGRKIDKNKIKELVDFLSKKTKAD